MSDRGQVFIVNGDTRSIGTLRNLLENSGYVVNSAGGGEDALAAIPAAESNLVLLDAHLPDIDAFNVGDEFKRRQQTLNIPIIFIAAFDDAEAMVKGLERGDHLTTKPFDEREVLAR